MTAPVRLLAALGLAALLLAAFASLQAPPLRAQTSPVALVSNLSNSGGQSLVNVMASSFETPAQAGKITVSGVKIRFSEAGPGIEPTATIREDDGGEPGALVATLIPPMTYRVGVNNYTAPADTMIAKGTTYWVVVNDGVLSRDKMAKVSVTTSDVEEGEPGWSITHRYAWKAVADSPNWTIGNGAAVKFAVLGTVAPPPPPLIATSELELLDNPLGNTEEVGQAADAPVHAQAFTTGSDLGYTLTKIELHVSKFSTMESGGSLSPEADFPVTVKLKEDNGGVPGALLSELVGPDRIQQDSYHTFSAPAPVELEPEKPYWVVINEGVPSRAAWMLRGRSHAHSPQDFYELDDTYDEWIPTDEELPVIPDLDRSGFGWTMMNGHLTKRQTTPADAWGGHYTSLIMRLHGQLLVEQSLVQLDDLVVRDHQRNEVALSPAFASDQFEYDAEVGHEVSRVTVSRTKSDSMAVAFWQDASGDELRDASNSEPGFQLALEAQVPGVADEPNEFELKVRRQFPGLTYGAQTYTLRVTRGAGPGGIVLSDPLINSRRAASGYPVDVRLSQKPSADVEVSLPDFGFHVVVFGSPMTFTPSDWDTPQRLYLNWDIPASTNSSHTGTYTAASADPLFDGAEARQVVNLDASSPPDYHVHRIKPTQGLEQGERDLPDEEVTVYLNAPYNSERTVAPKGDSWTPFGIWGDRDQDRVWVADGSHFGIHALNLSDLREGRIRRETAEVGKHATTAEYDAAGFDYRFNYECHFTPHEATGKQPEDGGTSNVDLTVLWGDADTIWVFNNALSRLDAYTRHGAHEGGRCQVYNTVLDTNGNATTEHKRFKTPFTRESGGDRWLNSPQAGRVQFLDGVWSDGSTMWLSGRPGGIYKLDLSSGRLTTSPEFGQFATYGLWSDGETMWVAGGGWLRAYELDTGARRAGFDIKLDNTELPGDVWSDGETIWVTYRIGDQHSAVGVIDAYEPPEAFFAARPLRSSSANAVEPLTASFSGVPEAHDGAREFSLRLAFSEDVQASPRSLLTGLVEELRVVGGTLREAARVDGRRDLWELTLVPDGPGPVSVLLSPEEGCAGSRELCTADGRPLSGFLVLKVPGPDGASGPPAFTGPPQTPLRPEATVIFAGGVDLSWAETPGADTYEVQTWRSGWLDLPGDGVEIGFYGAGAIISGLDPQSSLWFRLRAVNEEGVSDWSPMLLHNATSEYTLGDHERPENEAATGAPLIAGTPKAGATLWADTTAIEDGNGLEQSWFAYQWLSGTDGAETEIAGETHLTYLVAEADETIRVRVSFVDRAGYAESATSEALTIGAAATAAVNTPATGAPAITGAAQVGETLTADTSGIADVDGLGNAAYAYQWLAGDADIAGATAGTYTLVDADAGVAVKVKVSFTDDAGNEESLTSAATGTVEVRPNSPATGQPTISGTVQVGETLTADTSAISDTDGLTSVTFSYQWLADDADIAGATATAYTLTDADAGTVISVRVSFTDDAGNEETLTSAATDVVEARPNSPATGQPTIAGTAQVGETLTADTSGIADQDGLGSAVYSYQWLADDADIAGATVGTYTLVDADAGATIKVRVSFTDDADNEETLTSAATDAVQARPNSPATGQPTISGTAQVGKTLTADTSAISDQDGLSSAVYRYQWLADDADIAGATAGTYTLVDADEGVAVSVRVSFTDDAGNEETLTSAATDVVEARPNSPATGQPTIAGTAQVGETLTADTSGIADQDGLGSAVYSYQWLADDADIAGATVGTYTLVDADAGATIKVRVSFTDDADNEETLTSAATDAVQARPNSPATGQPTISGTAQVGETLTADTSAISDQDGLSSAVYRYQWLADDADIAGATAGTYTLVDADEGVAVRVRVSFTDDVGNEESLTSVATATVEGRPNSPATGAPSTSGTVQVGETLTADTSAIADTDGLGNAVYRYQWLADDADIAGATDSTYTLVDADEGAAVGVRVSFTDDAGNEESLTSAATDAVSFALQQQTANSPATGAPVITGAAQVGETLTADTSGISDQDGLSSAVYRYQWLADDADIAGATAGTYTLVDADEGVAVRVRVSFTDDVGNEESLTSVATATVEGRPNSPATGAPSTSGTVQVGETLTANTSAIADQDGLTNVSYRYQWLTDGADIAGATAGTYTLIDADAGTVISVRVSFTDDAGNEESLTSAATGTVEARPNSPATGQPTISGTAQVGETLTTATSGITDQDGLTSVAYQYQWLADGADIAGATAGTYTLVDADAGKTVRVRVSFTDDAGNEESLTSAATGTVEARPNSPATGLPTISGAARVGETLTADTSAIADADGLTNVSYGYQWIAGGTDLGGATGSTYTLTSAEVGKTVQVSVSFTDAAGNEETLTSAATGTVEARPNSPATGEPVIVGTPQVGETLTADTSGIADEDGLGSVTYSYQWLADGADIAGATAGTYTLVDADAGKTVRVRVSFTDDAGNEESLTSAATDVVEGRPNSPATGEPVIVGTPQVGETLTADTSGIADADGLTNPVYRYQWIVSDGGYDLVVPGAKASTYTVLAIDRALVIKVRVRVTDDRGHVETRTSAPTAVVR